VRGSFRESLRVVKRSSQGTVTKTTVKEEGLVKGQERRLVRLEVLTEKVDEVGSWERIGGGIKRRNVFAWSDEDSLSTSPNYSIQHKVRFNTLEIHYNS